jgi:heme-degrading monooxygenase HmoA
VSMLVIQHPVRDFQAWKKAFDSDPAGRTKNGVTRHAIYRPHDDPNYVVVTLEFSSREQAQAFLDHPAMRQAWKSFLGLEAETLPGGSHLRSRLGAEHFQARILDEIERVDY